MGLNSRSVWACGMQQEGKVGEMRQETEAQPQSPLRWEEKLGKQKGRTLQVECENNVIIVVACGVPAHPFPGHEAQQIRHTGEDALGCLLGVGRRSGLAVTLSW